MHYWNVANFKVVNQKSDYIPISYYYHSRMARIVHVCTEYKILRKYNSQIEASPSFLRVKYYQKAYLYCQCTFAIKLGTYLYRLPLVGWLPTSISDEVKQKLV